MRLRCLVTLMAAVALRGSAFAWDRGFDRESYEEDAGSSFMLFFSPDEDIYGLGFGSGTWLVNTPVFGDYAVRLYHNGLEKSYYSGIGMTLRIMPRWTWAPFFGAGGGYNHSLSQERYEDDGRPTRAASYWSGHADAGLRVWSSERSRFHEIMVRQTWNGSAADYALLLIGFGYGPRP